MEEGRGDAPGSMRPGAKGGGGKGGGAREVGERPHIAPGHGGKGSSGKGGETPKGGGRGGLAPARPVFAPGTTLYLRDLPQWKDLELAAPLACLQPLAVLTPRSRSGLGAGGRGRVALLQFASEGEARSAAWFLEGAIYGPRGVKNPERGGNMQNAPI